MITERRAAAIVDALERLYPDAACALEYDSSPWKLLVMARLSAQCTDLRVNIVCKDLFARYPDVYSMAAASLDELEEIVKPCGLYHTKAKNLKDMCLILADKYNGEIPGTMEELLRLPGVGRKIANLILGDVFGKPAIVTDTHCIRLADRLGFCDESMKSPYKVEKILSAIIPEKKQSDFCHRLVLFGRNYCTARNPKCGVCPLKELCRHSARAEH